MLRDLSKLVILCFICQFVQSTCSSSLQYYNITVVSDTNVVVSDTNVVVFNSDKSYNGLAVNEGASSLPGAYNIWKNSVNVETIYFQTQFYIMGTPTLATLQANCDDYSYVDINGVRSTCIIPISSIITCDLTSLMFTGVNTAMFTATNTGGPASLLFKLTIQSQFNS